MSKIATDLKKTSVTYFDPTHEAVKKRLVEMNASWKIPFFFLANLPSGLFWGMRIKKVTTDKAEVTLPYSWRTKNPFKSIYFAAQAGAAELSTALPATVAMAGQVPISMLIVKMEAEYIKKANSLVTFACEDGHKYQEAIQKALDTGEGHAVTATSVGMQENGEIVSRYKVTWSFKVKQRS